MNEPRDQYVASYVTRTTRDALERQALKRSLPVSEMIQILLSRALGCKNTASKSSRKPGQGRRRDPRGVLTEALRTAVLSTNLDRRTIARSAGFHSVQGLSNLLRRTQIVLSRRNLAYLAALARTLNYDGETHVESSSSGR